MNAIMYAMEIVFINPTITYTSYLNGKNELHILILNHKFTRSIVLYKIM